MLAKQNDPISKEKKINISPINHSELNKLSEDFGKHFVSQKKLSAEQAFWLPILNSKSEPLAVTQTPVEIEVPKELPKEVLVYVTATCPSLTKPSEKLVAITPLNKNKKVRMDEVPKFVIKFMKMIQVRLNATVQNIIIDNGTEFVNQTLRAYYEDVGISHQTSVARTPQQNDVVKRQNQTLVEAVRTTEALGKLKPKVDIGIFVGYAPIKKAYGIYNNKTCLIIETIHVDFDELTEMKILFQPMFNEHFNPLPSVASPVPASVALEPFDSIGTPSLTLIDQDAPSPNNNPFFGVAIQEPNSEESSSRNVIPTNVHSVNQPPKHLSKWTKDHLLDNVIGNPSRHVSTRYQLQNKAMFCYFDAFISFVELKNHKEALQESYRVIIITLKWIFKVKLDEVGGVLKNKARLVARGYRQEEGIDFEESFAPEVLVDQRTQDESLFSSRKRKRSSGKDSELSKTALASKKTSKGDTPPKSSKTGKYAYTEELVKEATHEEPNNNWFKQPPRPPTLDLECNSCQVIDDQPEQPCFNNLLSAQKDPLTFNELMANPIDFCNFTKNRLKLNKITKPDLVGPVYNILKAICQSNIELEYNMKECFKALTERLDWENPEGDRCPFYLSKPLPLKGCLGYLTVATKYFFNNDLEYLKSIDLDGKYIASITKTKAARYELVGIEDMILKQWSVTKVGYDKDAILSVKSMTVNKLHGYGYLEEIMVRRVDRQLYKFKEVIVDLAVAMHMFTRSLIIKKRVKDVQFGVESYQKKLNITKPQKDFLRISAKELYTTSFEPPGVVYEDLSHHKRLVRADELYKFSDGTLKKVRDTLHHRLLNF
uniref:Integrase catalytic domain-containing protein n=1 Tax=Tanacetum cinerariifolium TaxID=118510 RepID=A0A699HYW4_TANCI|nr:hypothetical protein [Tanacetum cinerariifolium]